MPYSFQIVEFWGVGRKIVHLYAFPIVREPCPYTSVLVVRGIVLNQEYFSGEIAPQYSFEIRDVGFGVEHRLKIMKEAPTIQFYGAENLEGVSLAGSRYFWLKSYARPCTVECRVLSEARLVFEEDGCRFVVGFFLIYVALFMQAYIAKYYNVKNPSEFSQFCRTRISVLRSAPRFVFSHHQ